MKRILIIFAKEPKKGRVKTRLTPYLSQAKCLALYKQLLKNTILLARSINCSRKIIAYDAFGRKPTFLKKIAGDFEFYKQTGKDLGMRMFNAFSAIISDNSKAIIIGSDSPNLPKSYIQKAFSQLARNDLVLGPTYDGGYYLIGLKKASPEIFKGIKWGLSSVFEQTLKKAKRLKKRITVLDPWYDVDRPQDLRYLERKL